MTSGRCRDAASQGVIVNMQVWKGWVTVPLWLIFSLQAKLLTKRIRIVNQKAFSKLYWKCFLSFYTLSRLDILKCFDVNILLKMCLFWMYHSFVPRICMFVFPKSANLLDKWTSHSPRSQHWHDQHLMCAARAMFSGYATVSERMMWWNGPEWDITALFGFEYSWAVSSDAGLSRGHPYRPHYWSCPSVRLPRTSF